MMKEKPVMRHFALCAYLLAVSALVVPESSAQQPPAGGTGEAVAAFDKALNEAKEASSDARKRLAVRRVIRDAEELLASQGESPGRFSTLEFLFRARQQLVALDDDQEHRKALLDTARELVKAPDDLAALRLEADLLLSQADLAKQGATAEARAQALRPFVERYLETPVAAKVLRLAMVMALELGDSRLVTDLQELIEERFAADLEMIAFQRDKLGGQVFGAPFTGTYERSDGKIVRFPMDGLGRSTMLVFWSKDDGGEALLKGLAAAATEKKEDLAGRLEIVSFNLDDLPDAGESVVRGLGADWQVLRLPDGRKNPIYDAYARSDPRILTMSPTGYTALVMSGTTRQKADSEGEPDYGRLFGSALAREWTDTRYVMQISSLLAGDFLVFDPDGGIDPLRPPELKALAGGGAVQPLTRTTASLPEESLRAIQDCFVAPPLRYRLSHAEARESYAKAVGLCRKAIADHPGAPDLWIARNRLIVALMGLWKTDADLGKLEEAVSEAKAALAGGCPPGCDLVARFCAARGALRDPAEDPRAVIRGLVDACGGGKASGPVLAAASLLALEVADRKTFEEYRGSILKSHTEEPMAWIFTSFLLDRHHEYWRFQVPFTAGWSYGRRANYFQTKGDIEEAHRMLRTELRTLDGEPVRIPQDLDSDWTVILFAQPGPWSSRRDDGLPPSPLGVTTGLTSFAASRPEGEVKVLLAMLGGEPAAIRENLEALIDPKRKQPGIECPVLMVPGGIANPLVHRLGILSEDNGFNSVLISRDGRIAVALSGLVSPKSGRNAGIVGNVIEREDEKSISAMLERGDIQKAKERIFTLAPPFDPEAVDDKGRKLRPPQYSLYHLRARARVYLALKEWDKALADAEEVVQRQLGTDGGMSLRTDELDESEALRDSILEQSARSKP